MLVQLSDPHVGADWGRGDSVPRLAAAVASVQALELHPDAVLVSGDLADHAVDVEYNKVRELLEPLGAPLYVLPGNHDDRRVLRRHFDVPGADGQPVQYSVDLAPVRLVVLDSTRAGEPHGELDADRLSWLEATLAAAPGTPTLLALHHPPLATGIPVFDELGLRPGDRSALGNAIEAHPQVCRIVAGHLHRAMSADLRGRSVFAAPSTYAQSRLDFGAKELQLSDEPPGFAVHAFLGGELVSHIQPVP